jgi:hypothetical protein
VGYDRRLADTGALKAMLKACEGIMSTGTRYLPCCGMAPAVRLKELPHVYGTDFDLFRCGRCGKAWVAAFVSAGPGFGWEPVGESDVEKMMSLDESNLRVFMKEWAKAFD